MLRLPPLHRELGALGEVRELMRSDVYARPPAAGREGQPVLLIPGFLASDRSMSALAGWLRRAGYLPRRSGIAFNTDCSQAESERLAGRLERAVEESGSPALIVGHSRGGMFARVLAVRRPDLVAGIATLAAPLVDAGAHVHPLIGMQASLISALGDLRVPGLLSNDCGDERMFSHDPGGPLTRVLSWRHRRRLAARRGPTCCSPFWNDFHAPFPRSVHFVSLYSRGDGILDWHATLDPDARHVEIEASHLAMGNSRSAYEALARELPAMAVRP